MRPEILEIFGLKIHSYGFMLALGFTASMLIGRREGKRIGQPPEHFVDLTFWLLFSSVIGARAFYVLSHLDRFLDKPLSIFHIWSGGLVFYGGFLGGLAGGYLFCRLKKVRFWKYADVVAPLLALGLAFGRVGCFLVGCCYGKPCAPDHPLAVVFPAGGIGKTGIPIYNTQMISSLNALLIFLFLFLWVRKRKRFHGQVFLTFAILYAVTRFVIELYRGDMRSFVTIFTMNRSPLEIFDWGLWEALMRKLAFFWTLARNQEGFFVQLSESQLMGLAALAIAIPLWFVLRKRQALVEGEVR